MKTFEQKIAETVNEKLNDGTVEKLVEQYIEKGVSDALNEVFSWSGEGKKLIEKKLNETIVPVIERHDFNQYLTKLDSVLMEIVNNTILTDNKKMLENFKELMKEHKAQGKTVFFSTHVLDVAEKICDRVAIISKGKLVLCGDMDELKRAQGDESLEEIFMSVAGGSDE